MAAPSYVPTDPTEFPRDYESPVRRPESWWADRPAELKDQPHGSLFGNPGPDIGYAVGLVKLFADKLHLTEHEHARDVNAGAVAVAMKRAALFGRAPVVHDLTLAYTVWGYLDPTPDPALVEIRKELFTEAGGLHGYPELRLIAAAVPDETLRKSHRKVTVDHQGNWRALLSL